MSSTLTTLGWLLKTKTFLDRLDELQNESAKKGGTADGVNHQIEYGGDLVNATVYTATQTLTSPMLEKFLKDYTDMLGRSESLADYAGDNVGEALKDYWYQNPDRFHDMFVEPNGNNYNNWLNATPEERANWVNAGGLPYGAYNPSNSFIPIRRNDPLVLDLNGDGIINTISMTNSKAFFDTNGDGMKTLTGWISGEDEITLIFIKPMKYINNSLYKANFEIVA